MNNEAHFIDSLKWRYATKAFDPDRPIDDVTMNALLAAVSLSPSSVNLQPYRVDVIRDRKTIAALESGTWLPNKGKIAACPALFVFTVLTDIGAKTVDTFLDTLARDRGMDRGALVEIEKKAKAFIEGMAPADRISWARQQAYLALGFLLSAAAAMAVDSCPMEGFDAVDYDRILGLTEQNQTAAVLAAVGYRSDQDAFAKIPKYRIPRETLINIG